MKDITLKIIGKNCMEGAEEEQLEFVTEGQLYEKNGALYMMYNESEICGMPGCKTLLKLKENNVKMRRYGDDHNYGTEMTFEQGKRFSSRYATPYGPMDMEILTYSIDNNISLEDGGDLSMDYHVSLNGLAEGRNKLKISVM